MRTYNLSVEGVHTFFVVIGTTSVPVHNEGPFCGVQFGGNMGDERGADEDFHGSPFSLEELVEMVAAHSDSGNPDPCGRPRTTRERWAGSEA